MAAELREKRVSVSMSQDEYNRFYKLALKDARTVAGMIYVCAMSGLDAREAGERRKKAAS